ncbi:hypothetical protein [Treponema medium]|uniref:hypothetical protein n=1 Tax=Treponema medium TaxID=58231 RepID=UPI00197DCC2F|nr:hypothetical protein [Treponema medium]
MLSQRNGFLQHQPPLSKVQLLFSVAAYFQKVVDIPEKRAAFSVRQRHYFFSSIFADGKRAVSVFNFAQKRYFAALGILCALGMQKRLHNKHIINIAFYRRSRPAVWFDSG